MLVVTADRLELPLGVFDSCAECDHHYGKRSGFASTEIKRMAERYKDRIPTKNERAGTMRFYLVDIEEDDDEQGQL